MPATPWVTFRRPDPDQDYLVLLSELPLKRWRDVGAFLLYTWRIQGQLRRTPGLLGYTLFAYLLTRQFWTLSVWEGAVRSTRAQHPRQYGGATSRAQHLPGW